MLGDNESLNLDSLIDSRSVGPFALSAVLGRVVYAAECETRHAPVENSLLGMKADAPVLEAELDIARICKLGAGPVASAT